MDLRLHLLFTHYIRPILLGFLGMALFWSAWHLYTDHQTWHAVLDQSIRAAQQQGQQFPQGSPPQPEKP